MTMKALVVGCAAFGFLAPNLAKAQAALTQWETADPSKGGEEAESQAMSTLLINQLNKDYTSQGKRVLRDAHPHAQGCVKAQFTVNANLDPAYQVGIYAQPGQTYDALVRFSSSGALGLFPDNVPDARGMAIKLFGVQGNKFMPDAQAGGTQDLIMINYPIFPTSTASEFQDLATAGFGNPLPFISVSSPQQVALRVREVANLLKSTVLKLNDASLLQMQFYSMTPYLFRLPSDPNATPIKFSARPCQPLNDSATKPLLPSGTYLRDELQQHLLVQQGCFDFLIQLYQPNQGFDIESGASLWSESISTFIPVARLIIPQQTFTTDAKDEYCDNLVYQPWHALYEHQPLGNINRVRHNVYQAITTYRHTQNGATSFLTQPVSLDAWNQLQ